MENHLFQLKSKFRPNGDQEQAIEKLVEGLNDGFRTQVLLGVTGSGKTFTMANVIERVQRPALVIAHNKTLAAQLCNEFREFFPDNRVEFFVSYYDYYQPEAYIPRSDTYIERSWKSTTKSTNSETARQAVFAKETTSSSSVPYRAYTGWARPKNTLTCPSLCAPK